MNTLDDVRFKELDELSNDDKKVINDNVADLTDEEKEVFKDVIGEPKKEEHKEEEIPTFKTHAELDAYLDKRLDDRLAERESQRVEEDRQRKEAELHKDDKKTSFFDSAYKPKDWNDFATALFEKMTPVMIEKYKDMTKKEQEDFNKKILEIDKKYDAEIDVLRKTDATIPASGTEERKTFDKGLAKIAIEYNVPTMTAAYKIYKLVGFTESKKDDNKRNIAVKIGGGHSPTDSGGKIKFKDIHSKSMDELLEDEVKS